MTQTDELISIVMPVHNGGIFLAPAIDSILSQSHRNLELIVVDDHSSDRAIDEIPATIKNDPRLLIASSPTRGVTAAMEAGVARAQGHYIARMDGDDIAHPQRLSIQLSYLKNNPAIGIVGGRVEIFSEKGIASGNQIYEQWLNRLCTPQDIAREIFIESPIPNPTAFFRRNIYEKLGGYRNSLWAEDYDLWLRAFENGIGMGKPKPLVLKWRDHPARLTRRDRRYDPEQFMAARAHYLARTLLKGRSLIIWGAGQTGAALCDALAVNKITAEKFIDIDLRRIGGKKRGRPVVAPEEIFGPQKALIVGAVGSRGARQEIRAALLKHNKVEGSDFIFVA